MALKNKLVVEKIIEDEGLYSAIKIFGGIDNVIRIVNKPALELTQDFFYNNTFSTDYFDVSVGTYNFKFIVNEIEEQNDTWYVDVKIMNGTVDIDGDERELWDSDLWGEEYWWEIQNEIGQILNDILEIFSPNEIKWIDMNHNLE